MCRNASKWNPPDKSESWITRKSNKERAFPVNVTKGRYVTRFFTLSSSIFLIILVMHMHVKNHVVPIPPLASSGDNNLSKALCLPIYDDTSKTFQTVSITDISQCIIHITPSRYISILSKLLLGTPLGGSYHHASYPAILPFNASARDRGADWPPFGYTMIGMKRLENLRCALEELNRNKIPGAIVEFGVWRGGAMMLASAINLESNRDRDIYLFDAFDVIPNYGKNKNYLSVNMTDVQDWFQFLQVDGPHIHYVKGLFQDTVPSWKENIPIALLRIDGNYYDSYQDAMYYMYEKVPVGGIVIFDDVFSHGRVMRFWMDFKREQGLPEELNRIDFNSGWFRKTKDVHLDWSFFRAPQDVNK